MTDRELQFALRMYCRRRPFRPFLIEFVSGIRITVEHPDQVAGMRDIWYYRGPKRTQSLFASSSVCRLMDITEAEK